MVPFPFLCSLIFIVDKSSALYMERLFPFFTNILLLVIRYRLFPLRPACRNKPLYSIKTPIIINGNPKKAKNTGAPLAIAAASQHKLKHSQNRLNTTIAQLMLEKNFPFPVFPATVHIHRFPYTAKRTETHPYNPFVFLSSYSPAGTRYRHKCCLCSLQPLLIHYT